MRISDWSSDVCSSDLTRIPLDGAAMFIDQIDSLTPSGVSSHTNHLVLGIPGDPEPDVVAREHHDLSARVEAREILLLLGHAGRSDEHTSELKSLMSISYAEFCLKKKTTTDTKKT